MAFEISHYTELLCQVSAKSVDHNFWTLEHFLRQWHLITKTSFTELDNKELHFCSGLSVMLQILALSMASKRIGIPPSCLQKFLPSRSFLFKKWIHPQFWRNAISFGTFPPGKQDYLLRNSVAPGIFQLEQPAKSCCSIYFSTGYFQKLFGNG